MSQSIVELAPHISNYFSLAAFAAAVGAGVVRYRLSIRKAAIARASGDELSSIVGQVLDSFHIPTASLNGKQQLDLALEALRQRTARLTLLLVGSLLFAALGAVTYLMTPAEDISPQSRAVISMKERVMDIRGDYEALDKYPTLASKVSSDALKQANVLEAQQDTFLDTDRKILKRQYRTYALTIAASAATTPAGRFSLAERALDAGRDALAFYESVKSLAEAGDLESERSYRWLIEDDGLNRTLYLTAWAAAIVAEKSGVPAANEASSFLARVDCEYLSRFPPRQDKELHAALSSANLPQRECEYMEVSS